ncbi:regulatory protein RecX [Rhodococcus sp. SORGH_AS_0303]|uniref:regulatory protein RecX n=1 Tax=Rhodococcus sp. SORGH_AS_0303 TaxID=3041753 RepID=UPI002780F2F3|nr:regulatory protein [Rhodococcus sp. SORGH_AS_0303]
MNDDEFPDSRAPGARRTSGARSRSGRRSGETPPPGGGTAVQAKDAALRLLTDRARSRVELEQRLAAKGFTDEIITSVLDRLTEIKLVDDRDFAHQWVRSRHTYSGRGKQALRRELRTKGIDPVLATEALDMIEPEGERERARELVVKKLRAPALLSALNEEIEDPRERRAQRDKVVRKLVSMLARRGFAQGMAFDVVRTELEALGNDSEGLEY